MSLGGIGEVLGAWWRVVGRPDSSQVVDKAVTRLLTPLSYQNNNQTDSSCLGEVL